MSSKLGDTFLRTRCKTCRLSCFMSPLLKLCLLHHSVKIPLFYFSPSVHKESFMINHPLFKTFIKGMQRWEQTTYKSLWAPKIVAGPGISNLNKRSKQHELLRDTQARRRYLLISKAMMCTQCQNSREVPRSQAQVVSWRPSSLAGSRGEGSVVL